MNKTITIYGLLGLIKDGKAPKKIKLTWNNEVWYWNDYDSYVTKGSLKKTPDAQTYLFDQYRLFYENSLNKEVKILDEFIEIEEMPYCEENTLTNMKTSSDISIEAERLIDSNFKEIGNYINQLIHNQKILIEKMKEKE